MPSHKEFKKMGKYPYFREKTHSGYNSKDYFEEKYYKNSKLAFFEIHQY